MKFSNFLFLLLLLSTACTEDAEEHIHDGVEGEFQYHTHIMTPDTADKKLAETLSIAINFESKTENTIHHVNVKIYSKTDPSVEIYNRPAAAHIHETDGLYEYRDELVLSTENGVSANSDWVLEAKVWGHEAGVEELIEMLEFHVE